MAEKLLPHNFDLAFRALHAFGGARPARTFASVAASLARRDDLAALKSLLQSVQGTITDEEWDEVRHILMVQILDMSLWCLDQSVQRCAIPVQSQHQPSPHELPLPQQQRSAWDAQLNDKGVRICVCRIAANQ